MWLGLLAGVGLWSLHNIKVGSDLTAFLPAAEDESETLLLDELQNGAASRLIPISLSAKNLDMAAALSKRMAQKLREDTQFTQVHNGQQTMDRVQLEWVMSHRYLLSPKVDASRFTQEALASALQERLWELGSAAELAVKDFLARDPTHESLAIFAQWRPQSEPETHRGIWVQTNPQSALMMVETAAPGFDLDAQALAVSAIRQAFEQSRGETGALAAESQLVMTGPGPFGVQLRQTTQRESQLFSTVAVVLLMAFLFWVYRSVRWVIIGALPLATGLLLAIVIVNTGFGGVHGITLAFGVTLLGVAIDYPLHVFSHHAPGSDARQTVSNIWPTLRLGVASTCIAYLTMVFSDFEGLAQLGWLTVMGLLVAAVASRWGLPRLMTTNSRVQAVNTAQGWASRWHDRLTRAPRIHWGLLLLASIFMTAWLSNRPLLWQDDLGSLTPVPVEQQLQDQALRQALAAPDLRYMALLKGETAEAVLQASEKLSKNLDSAIAEQWLAGYDSPTRYLPSQATQRQRQAALPDAETLARRLSNAQADMPFKSDLFRPFEMEVAQARVQPLITPESMRDAPLAGVVSALLKQTEDGQWRALLPLHGVSDSDALKIWFEQRTGVQLLDLKQASESMVAGFRAEMLWRIALATAVILAILIIGLQPRRRWLFVLLPVIATVLGTASILQLVGVTLSLFHMTSLMLVGGIVLDYALFFDREETDPEESVRTLHALSVCCVSTLTVFGILGLSQIPVLRAIGVTVACGVVLGYFLAVLGRRRS